MNKIKELLRKIEEATKTKIVYLEFYSDGSWLLLNVYQRTLCEGGVDSEVEQELQKYLESLS